MKEETPIVVLYCNINSSYISEFHQRLSKLSIWVAQKTIDNNVGDIDDRFDIAYTYGTQYSSLQNTPVFYEKPLMIISQDSSNDKKTVIHHLSNLIPFNDKINSVCLQTTLPSLRQIMSSL